MLNNKIKQKLDEFKSTKYKIHKVNSYERIDQIISKYYNSERAIIYFKPFCYLNDIIYPFEELQQDDLLKIYDLDKFFNLLEIEEITILNNIYK